jgi:spermidine synthase
MPGAQIDVVELDPGVIAAGKKYFRLRETDKVRFIESDGREYLNRHKEAYDLILLDAFRELVVPFHMLTREFYALVKEHFATGGAMASNVVANKNFTFRLWSPCMRCSQLSMFIRLGANRTKHRRLRLWYQRQGRLPKV